MVDCWIEPGTLLRFCQDDAINLVISRIQYAGSIEVTMFDPDEGHLCKRRLSASEKESAWTRVDI